MLSWLYVRWRSVVCFVYRRARPRCQNCWSGRSDSVRNTWMSSRKRAPSISIMSSPQLPLIHSQQTVEYGRWWTVVVLLCGIGWWRYIEAARTDRLSANCLYLKSWPIIYCSTIVRVCCWMAKMSRDTSDPTMTDVYIYTVSTFYIQ